MGSVRIVEPSPAWPEEFERAAAELREVLGPLAVRIDHVGSTSIPGLPAKDVIDVQVGVADDASLRSAATSLRSHGFAVIEDASDHVVPSLDPDPTSWAKVFAEERPTQRRTNIHVRVVDRANHRFALLFRDFVREHTEWAEGYVRFKRAAAAAFPEDSLSYSLLKDPVCDLIVLAATDWAARP
jgi:GrpB-like predicted nucleotidyltransferase (UPF0157 family)